jgi:GNAT superfamily N-acetyltransferase
MNLRTVQTDKDLDAFIDMPYHFYRGDPVWVPPLRSEQRGQFDPKRNPLLNHCEYGLFLLESEGRVNGRIAAFIDNMAVAYWKQLVGLFGYYECPRDGAASRLLLDAAAGWLKGRGMKAMRGPWTFVSQEWGLVVEGFTPQPVVMAPYNPPYYIDHMTDYGLQKVKDLLCYSISGSDGYRVPDRILRLTDAVAHRYGVRVRRVDMRQYEREVETIMELSNVSLAGNWGYSPVTPEEVQAMARDLKAIIQPRGVLFAEDARGKSIGFAIAIPDANILLKGMNGRLLPFGWMKLLFGLPRLRAYRMFALGVVPEYQGKGIDSLLYRALYESLFSPAMRMEINYVLEDNHPMNNAIRKLDAKPLRRYRIYEKEI